MAHPFCQSLVHLTLLALAYCIRGGCNFQLNDSRSYCDNRDRHSDHTILEKVTSKILGGLARQGGLQSIGNQLLVGHGDWVSDLFFYMLD